MSAYKLSIIIPCHNSSSTIGKLLDSIIKNNLEKDTYEVIVVDDNSTDNFMDIVNTYNDRLNIVYYKTNTTVHCPGNTRQVGLENAKGEWITFIDHDDYFQPNVFKKVFKVIEDCQVSTVVCTSFYSILKDNKKQIYNNDNNIPWLHGKFYNHQMLLDGNINFKKDLVTHEDVYFNNLLEVYMHVNNKRMYKEYNLITYNWVQRIDSLSHYREGDMTYVDLNLKDYIFAYSDPFFKLSNFYKDYKVENILHAFLLFYFIFQQGIYRLGYQYSVKNFHVMKEYMHKICYELNMTAHEILIYLYDDAKYYHNLKGHVFADIDFPFIENQSLRDFVNSLK